MIGKFLLWLQELIKHWIKPATPVLVSGVLSDLSCSRIDLVVENALLLLRWHRELFRIYWRQKPHGKIKVSLETISLIQKIAKENRLWGTERIRGELLKLGIAVSKRSIQKYTPKEMRSRSSSQTWGTFLKNQAGAMWACDFTVVYDWLFRQWYIFVVMELETRRIVHTGATKFPTDEWTAQQLREATPWGRDQSI